VAEKHGWLQIFVDTKGHLFVRMEWGYSSNQYFSGWKRFVAEAELADIKNAISAVQAATRATSRSICKIFKKVVCCGDSYTSGHIVEPGGASTQTNEDYAWPHYMATATGNDWINCGQSGANVLTWQTWERGLPKAQAAGKAQAYIIGLMINDTASGTDRYVELGTAADIGTNASTYYAGLSSVIRKLNAISPRAKIFVQTCPRAEAKYAPYNQAVRDVVEAYKGAYPVHCLDLFAYKDLYDVDSLKADEIGGHFTAVGYEQFAEILQVVLSDYINAHIEDFQDVHLIEYD
jgi:lysophospholipase L1-like esterase